MRSLIFAFACLFGCLTGGFVFAQDRQGRDTPGEWIVTHHHRFGQWDSICDKRITRDLTEQRCYLRYVDVFSPHPDFAAQFLFITPQMMDFGTERGTRFVKDGFRIEGLGKVVWSTEHKGCLRGGKCTFSGTSAEQLIAAMLAGRAFRFDFTDRHGRTQNLEWDLDPFADAWADYQAALAALPKN